MIVTSFYTPTWTYPEHARRFMAECDALGVEHYVVERPDAGGYLANCRQKPVHILETMERFGRPLLWVDVDASIMRPPELPDADFAAVRMPKHRDRVWHVAALFFSPTPEALELLELWVGALDDESSDEAALDRAWPGWASACSRWAELGADYMNIEGRSATPNPVIVHRLSKSPAKRAFQRAR